MWACPRVFASQSCEQNRTELPRRTPTQHHTFMVHPQRRLYLLWCVFLPTFTSCLASSSTTDALQAPSRCFVFVFPFFLLLDRIITPVFHLYLRRGWGLLVYLVGHIQLFPPVVCFICTCSSSVAIGAHFVVGFVFTTAWTKARRIAR